MIQFFRKKGKVLEENSNLKKDLAITRQLCRHNAATLFKAVMELRETRRENKRLMQRCNVLERELRGVKCRKNTREGIVSLEAKDYWRSKMSMALNEAALARHTLLHDWYTKEKRPMRPDRLDL